MWKWVNEPRPGRLFVSADSNIIRFSDLETGEYATVIAPDSLNVAMAVFRKDEQIAGLTIPDAQHFVKGNGIAERDVWHYVTKEHATALRAGLTIHRSAFSSTPHEFETKPEKGFEEAFYFLLPDGGKALLEGEGLWSDGTEVDAAWPVRHRQLAQVPMGWHRVAALPLDASGKLPVVAYVWCYLCNRPEWEK